MNDDPRSCLLSTRPRRSKAESVESDALNLKELRHSPSGILSNIRFCVGDNFMDYFLASSDSFYTLLCSTTCLPSDMAFFRMLHDHRPSISLEHESRCLQSSLASKSWLTS